MVTTRRGVSARRRSLALASLVCGALLALAMIVIAVRNLGFLVVGLLGIACAVAGCWWVITEQMPRRE